MNFTARLFLVSLCLLGAVRPALALDPARQCAGHVAQWLAPGDGAPIAAPALYERMAGKSIVLLGEVHDNAAHHRWQHNTLAALHSRQPNLVVGLEMLPRRVQPVLDDWSRGALDEETFLQRAQWQELWGYDAELYLPILRFTRMHRLPTIAINIDRQLVSRVGSEGWDALPTSERMGLSDPAPASAEYRRELGELYAYKMSLGMHGNAGEQQDAPDLEQVMQSKAFANFVDAQLTWDRAMAEALAAAHRLDPQALVVAIVGRGHLEYGYGIPHQLADLGIDDAAVLLPLDADADCHALTADLADAVFVVEAQARGAPAPGPRLGVMIETADQGVRVMEVIADSVAARSGLQEGDIIRRAAGFETATSSELIEVIKRQAPGTWLPLEVLRGERTIEIISRFPQTFE